MTHLMTLAQNTLAVAVFAVCISCKTTAEAPSTGPTADRTPRTTVEALAAAGHPEISGTLTCEQPGSWTLYAWRLHSLTPTVGPDQLPLAAPEVAIPLAEAGPYTLHLPEAPRRLVPAVHDGSGEVAWTVPHGRARPISDPLVDLDLACSGPPTAAPDGSRWVAQGTPVLPPIEVDPSDAVPLEQTALARHETSALHRLARSHQPSGHPSEAAVRHRYEPRLGREPTELLMPMLLQLARDPDAADAFVAQHQRTSRRHQTRTRDAQVIEVAQ